MAPSQSNVTRQVSAAEASGAAMQTVASGAGSQPAQVPQIPGYKIGPELGRGGMGIVYEATEIELGRRVALKILPDVPLLSQARLERFRIEAHAAATLEHDNIVQVYQIGSGGGVHYYTMRLIHGHTLAQVLRIARALGSRSQAETPTTTLRDQAGSTEPIDSLSSSISDSGVVSDYIHEIRIGSRGRSGRKIAQLVASIGAQVADGLQHAHDAGIIHRDIKPSNLIIDANGKVWITDFGLARLADSVEVTRTGEMIGTLYYMSPEQALGKRGMVDHRSDIYSLGATLYELATLQRPVRGRTTQEVLRELAFHRPVPIHKLNPRIPNDLEAVINKCLHRDPADRYQSARELAEDLHRILRGDRPRVKPLTWKSRFRNWLVQHPRVAAAAGIGLVSVALLGTVFAVLSNRALVTQRKMHLDAEGSRLLAQAALYQEQDPPLAIGLASLGAKLSAGWDAHQVLVAAADHNHMLAVLDASLPRRARVAFSADGTRFATFGQAAGGGQAIVWDAGRRTVVQRLSWPNAINALAFDQTGDFLAVQLDGIAGDSDGHSRRVEIWQVGNPRPELRLAGYSMASGPAGPFLAEPHGWLLLIDANGQPVVLDQEHQVVALLQTDAGAVDVATIGTRKDVYAIVTEGAEVQLVDRQSGLRDRWQLDSEGTYAGMQIGGEGRSLLVQRRSAQGGMLRGWWIQIDQPDAQPVAYRYASAALSPDGRRLALQRLYRDGSIIELRDAASGRNLGEARVPTTAPRMAFVDRGRTLAVASMREILLFQADNCAPIGTCRGAADYLSEIAAQPRSDRFLSIGTTGQAVLWSARSDRQRRTIPLALRSIGTYLSAFSRDGTRLLVGPNRAEQSFMVSLDQPHASVRFPGGVLERTSDYRPIVASSDKIQVWDEHASNVLFEMEIDTDRVVDVAAINGADALLIRTKEGESWYWPMGELPRRLLLDDHRIVAVNCAARTPLVAVIDASGELLLLNGRDLSWRVLPLPEGSAVDAHVTANGDRVAVTMAGPDGGYFVSLRNTATGEEIWRSPSRKASISEAVTGMGGDRVLMIGLTATGQLEVELWDVAQNQRMATMQGDQPWQVRRSESERYLSVALRDETVVVDLESGQTIPIGQGRPAHCDFLGDRLIAVLYGAPREEVTEGSTPATDTDTTKERQTPPAARASNRLDIPMPMELVQWSPENADAVQRKEIALRAGTVRLHACRRGAIITDVGGAVGEVVLGKPRIQNNYMYGTFTLRLAAYVGRDQSILTVGAHGGIRMYGRGGDSCRYLVNPVGQISAAALTRDTSLLAVAGSGGVATIDTGQETTVHSFDVSQGQVDFLEFDAAGNHLLMFGKRTGGQPLLQLWDLRADRTIEFDVKDLAIDLVRLSPAGQEVIVLPSLRPRPEFAGPDQSAERLLIYSQDRSTPTVLETDAPAADAVFTEDGNHIVVLESTGAVSVYDRAGLTRVHRWFSRNRVRALSAHTGDPNLIAGLTEQDLILWDLTTGQVALQITDLKLGGLLSDPPPLQWKFATSQSQWWCIPHRDRVVCYPRDARQYVQRNQPRELTEAELAFFRIPHDLLQ